MSERLKKHKVNNETFSTYLELVEETEIKEEDRGFILRCFRKGMALSLKELEKEIGLSVTTLQGYENGKRKIPTVVWYGLLYYFKKQLEMEKEQKREVSEFLRYL